MLTTEVKALARGQVIEKIGKFLGVTLLASIIPVLIVMIGTMIFTLPILAIVATDNMSGIMPLFIGFMLFMVASSLFVISPTAWGVLRCYYDMQKTGDFKVSTVFSGFSSLRSIGICIKHSLINYILIFTPFLALIIVIAITVFLVPIVYPLVFVISMIAFSLWAIIVDFKSYAVYFYIFNKLDKNDDEKISIISAYKKIFKDLKGYNSEILYFSFSFILWSLLSFIPFIGSIAIMVFVHPYMTLSYVYLSEKILGSDDINNNDDSSNIVDYSNISDNINVIEVNTEEKVNLEEINLKISNINETDIPKDEK